MALHQKNSSVIACIKVGKKSFPKLGAIIKARYTNSIGYLLYQSEEDRTSNSYTCYVFNKAKMNILVTDLPHMLEYNIGHHLKINRHAAVSVLNVGYHGTDFINNRMSCLMTFTFNITSAMINALGL